METKRGEQKIIEQFDAEIETDAKRFVVPVVEEFVSLGKEIVETGKVRVSKRISEREELIDEPLFHEEVSVERVPVNRYVDVAPPVRHEGDVMIVSVVQEQLVMQKRLVLVEELRIRKQVVETHQPQTVVLRREEVDVTRIAETNNSGD